MQQPQLIQQHLKLSFFLFIIFTSEDPVMRPSSDPATSYAPKKSEKSYKKFTILPLARSRRGYSAAPVVRSFRTFSTITEALKITIEDMLTTRILHTNIWY